MNPTAKAGGLLEKKKVTGWVRSALLIILTVLVKRPKFFPLSLFLAAYGYHFRKVADKIGKGYCAVPTAIRVEADSR